jgi:hypothetical protein
MSSPLTHWTTVLETYLRRGHEGLADVQSRLEAEARRQPGGTFSKREALYLPQTPFPPMLWPTSCERCRFWHDGGPGEAGTCHVVGREGDRFGGERVHSRGWCAYWMPPDGEPPFAWLRQRFRPDGRTSVRGLYDTERTSKERRRSEQGRQEAGDGEGRSARPQSGRRSVDPTEGKTDG